ncbi:serine/threonine-protein kinase [Streptomyces sp. NPDC006997]|uniref:serine/threonine-protein kinase n=1 Tax=Streptomyces sp. NPDC006997 TaxID=3155356 RepID=UPI0033C40B56
MRAEGAAGEVRALRPEDPGQISGYPLLARIGEGGMGTVYLSRTRGNRPVALKVIRREHAEEPHYRRRFAREAQAARKVAGYHLVPVLDFDTDAGQPWIVTPYQPGLSLDTVLGTHGPLPVESVLQIAGCVARALHAVHTAGYVHRDVKPSNVLVGADGPWLIDFGIARSADATDLTVTGGIVGTPRFMSPEHARGQDPGPPSDVFSLGLLSAVAATGRHPYGDGSALGIAARIAGTDTQPPDLDGCPAALRGLLGAALAADPAQRPTAAEFAARCEQAAHRPLNDFGAWLPAPVTAAVAAAEQRASGFLHAPRATVVAPPAGFGPPPPMAPPPAAAPRPDRPRRRRQALVAALAVAAVTTAAVTVPALWRSKDGEAGSARTSQPTGSPGPAREEKGDGATGAPYAPPGYRPLFVDKPFTFAPPLREDQANHLDLDIPQAAYLERDALPGPAELLYTSDGWLGSVLLVVGKRKTVCTEEQQTAVLPHPLPAAELRLGRLVRTGTTLCAVTSDDHVAEARITEIVPGRGTDGLPTYRGYVTVWERPAPTGTAAAGGR